MSAPAGEVVPLDISWGPGTPSAIGPRIERRLGRALSVGLISGMGYRNLRGGLKQMCDALHEHPELPHRICHYPEEIEDALEDFRERDIDVVAVNGGDGTLGMVVSSLLRRGGRAPKLAVLAGGRTNMSAGDVGFTGDQVRQFRRIVARAESGDLGPIMRRPVLEVSESPDSTPHYGFFVGGAAIYLGSIEAWKYREDSGLSIMRTGLGTATSVMKMLAGHFMGGSPVRPSGVRVVIDDEELEPREWLLLFATSLERMALGMRPFWDEGGGPIRFTGVAHRNRHLLKAAASCLRGKTNRFVSHENGHYSRNAHRIDLYLEEGATIDGEVVKPVGDHPVRITADRSIDFLEP